MINDQGVDVEALDLSVGLGVLEHTQKDAARLLWPATLGGWGLELLGLGGATDGARESVEWNTSLLGNDGLHVGNCLVQVHTLDQLYNSEKRGSK